MSQTTADPRFDDENVRKPLGPVIPRRKDQSITQTILELILSTRSRNALIEWDGRGGQKCAGSAGKILGAELSGAPVFERVMFNDVYGKLHFGNSKALVPKPTGDMHQTQEFIDMNVFPKKCRPFMDTCRP